MLEKIKSFFIFKICFSNLNDKRKLELIKYNKKFQKLININIINYRQFSSTYIIYETKGKGKEYQVYNDELIYEGEFLRGKRNGKGKEYNNEKLIYKGEFLNRERNGKGINI